MNSALRHIDAPQDALKSKNERALAASEKAGADKHGPSDERLAGASREAQVWQDLMSPTP